MKTVQFEIPGPVKGKARPRVTRTGIAYTPKDTVQYENLVRCCYREQVGSEYLEGPLSIIISALYEIPKSTTKKTREAMLANRIFPTKKPDWDNIGKVICDSLNGVAYRDDSAIVSAIVMKQYTSEAPRVSVTLMVLNQEGDT